MEADRNMIEERIWKTKSIICINISMYKTEEYCTIKLEKKNAFVVFYTFYFRFFFLLLLLDACTASKETNRITFHFFYVICRTQYALRVSRTSFSGFQMHNSLLWKSGGLCLCASWQKQFYQKHNKT